MQRIRKENIYTNVKTVQYCDLWNILLRHGNAFQLLGSILLYGNLTLVLTTFAEVPRDSPTQKFYVPFGHTSWKFMCLFLFSCALKNFEYIVLGDVIMVTSECGLPWINMTLKHVMSLCFLFRTPLFLIAKILTSVILLCFGQVQSFYCTNIIDQ